VCFAAWSLGGKECFPAYGHWCFVMVRNFGDKKNLDLLGQIIRASPAQKRLMAFEHQEMRLQDYIHNGLQICKFQLVLGDI
jgi:hypothetical protein